MTAKQRHFIRQWRKHRGLTQEQLAERIGVSRSYLTKIERGDRRWDQPFMEAAAEALRVSVVDLLVRDPTEPESIWSIWEGLPIPDRPRAIRLLKAMQDDATGSGE